jgi:hypothetical protein
MEAMTPKTAVQLSCRHLLCERCCVIWARQQLHAQKAPSCPLDNQRIAYVTAFAATPPATAPAPPPTPPSRKSVHQQARTAIVGLTGAVVQREEPGLCTKQSALEATLRKHRGSRVLIFCCAPELEHYAGIVRTQQLSATLDVADFKADPTITALLLSHADSSGLAPSYSPGTPHERRAQG